jgi:uncharacterized membrane protein YhaH (DUF805 family)
MSPISALFGFRGRLGVFEYWGYSLFVGFFAALFVIAFHGRVLDLSELWELGRTFLEHPEEVAPELLWSAGIFFWSVTAIKVKRLHDLNLPGWWSMFWCVPLTLAYLSLDLGKAAVEQESQLFSLLSLLLAFAGLGGAVWSVWISAQEMFFFGDDQSNGFGPPPGAKADRQPVTERIALAQSRRINPLNQRY